MSAPVTKHPLFFLKPTSSIIFHNQSINIPDFSHDIQHEVELGIVMGKKCRQKHEKDTLDYVFGYLVALDITARDIQQEAKQHGWPWSIAKGFDTFCPISSIVLKKHISNPDNLNLSLKVNGNLRQYGNTSQLIFPVQSIISYISKIMTLEKGDLILTGTPEGVQSLKKGDCLEAELEGYCRLKVYVQKN
jgi:2-keto-4-pentenoate hydratase/2-oxohepta-3-ene-1,7-dioic acid hydratase in catechol pathway